MKKLVAILLICITVISACTTQQVDNKFYKEGVAYLDNFQYSLALEQFKLSINEDNNHVDSYLKAADILISKGRYDEALTLLDKAVHATDSADVYQRLGDISLTTYKLDAALNNYSDAIKRDPGNQEAVKGKINVLALSGKDEQAVNFIKGLNISENDQELQIIKGLILISDQEAAKNSFDTAAAGPNDRLAEIAVELKELTEKLENKNNFLFNLAKIAFTALENGWYAAAYPITNQMLAENQYYEGGFLYKGVILLNFNNYDEAVKNLEKVLQLNPNDASANILLAKAYYNSGKNDKAAATLKKLNTASPAAINQLPDVLDLLIEFKNYDLAINFVNKFQKSGKEITPEIRLRWLKALVNNEKYQKAREIADMFTDQETELENTQLAEVLAYTAYTDFKLGEKSTAMEQLNRAISLDRSLAVVYYFQAVVLLDQKNFEEAQMAAERAIDLDFNGEVTTQSRKLLAEI